MKKRIVLPLRARNLWMICGAYALYLLIQHLSSQVDPVIRYGISAPLHFILVLGFLLLVDSRNRLYFHHYCFIRFSDRGTVCKARMLSLFAETLVYWLPHCTLMIYAGSINHKNLGASFAITALWLANLFVLGVFVTVIDTLFTARRLGALLFGLLLSLDYLQATGSLISPDISWFYKPVFQLFASDTVATRDLAASAGGLAATAVVAFLLLHHCFSMELQKGHLAPWLRSSVRRVWIGLPLGAILALWGKRYAPGGMEELWLLTFGMISFEDLSGFFLILVNSLPFLLACFLFGINQSEDSLAVNVLSVTREGTRRFWWRRRQVTLFVSSTCYALMILLGTAFTGFCFGLRVADLSEAADGLLALICTKMAVGYVLLLGSSVLCLLMDARYVFLLMSGVYMGGQLLTFVPRTAFVTAVLRIFLPCRASLLLHECPKALQGMEDLFSRGIEGLHPEMTAVLSGISAVLLFGIGSRLAERTDLL